MNNFTEIAHASLPLGIFASKSPLLGWKAQPTETAAVHTANSHKTNDGGVGTPPYVAKSVSCRISVLELLLARNCHSYCCRRYGFRYSFPELDTRP